MALKKLVRDRIPEIIEKDTGEIVEIRTLDDDEFLHELKGKLLEEVREVRAAEDPCTFLKELADLQEVIDALTDHCGFTQADLRREQKQKREDRGGFRLRLFIVKTRARP
jgi:predicted house-cleaning noncanonical NTP pyrophosphatase (MazG superfamily)